MVPVVPIVSVVARSLGTIGTFGTTGTSVAILVFVNHHPQILPPPTFRTSADADQTIHLAAQVHHVAA